MINVNFYYFLTPWVISKYLKAYCTSIGQLLSYSKRWRSFCISCKRSSGSHTFFSNKTSFFAASRCPWWKKIWNLITTQNDNPNHIIEGHSATSKNLDVLDTWFLHKKWCPFFSNWMTQGQNWNCQNLYVHL